eukprot:Protomagalhaensia_sp_Gyna_25__759@NODE_1364_length_1906_cov_5_125870_g1096_i0_p2_GENE_NODE_1364_length_1906_cov_5_125870_g1096_i0NODE_1364_length_1906_cov_5_125870_g1096_i0_p2_ORF_typecomplete_len257_score24_27Ribophorin_I/PF04597_14/7_1e33_NODE_1364_length_1906_cov_5_125870_g1096_i02811051
MKIEETYALINEAAPFRGDYQPSDVHSAMRRIVGTRRPHHFHLSGSPVLFTLDAYMPRLGSEFEYYDSIGNVSTSHVAVRSDDYVIELEPRYPVLGGWSFDWTLKYLLPAPLWVREKGTLRSVSIPWSSTVSGLWADQIVAELVLPPLSRVKEIRTPHKAVVMADLSSTRRWLDLFTTRPVLKLVWDDVPVLYTSPRILLASVSFESSPLVAGFLHLCWLPAIIIVLISQPLVGRFFSLSSPSSASLSSSVASRKT